MEADAPLPVLACLGFLGLHGAGRDEIGFARIGRATTAAQDQGGLRRKP
jgi:hypothetical protein